MWTSSSEGSIAQSCAGSWNVAGSNIRRSKSPAASGCVELTVVSWADCCVVRSLCGRQCSRSCTSLPDVTVHRQNLDTIDTASAAPSTRQPLKLILARRPQNEPASRCRYDTMGGCRILETEFNHRSRIRILWIL